MRLLWEIARLSWRRHLTYRAAALAGVATNFFFGLVRAAIWLGLAGARSTVAGYDPADIVTYAALTQGLLSYLGLLGWYDLMRTVYTGEVTADLLKPMPLTLFWLGQDLGRAAVNLLLRGVTVMLLYSLVFDLVVPATVGAWLALLASIGLSWLVSFAFRFLLNLAAFWSPNALGVIRLGFVVAWLFSGLLMPLRFLPAWVQQVAYLTPFPYMLDTVVDVYLGQASGPALLAALGAQLAWAVGLLLAGVLVLRRGMRRLVILGG